MNVTAVISLRENGPLRDFVVCSGLALGWIGFDLAWSHVAGDASLRRATTYVLPGLAAVCLGLLMPVSRQGGSDRFPRAAAAGSAFIVGGAAIDLSTTVAVNPDLTLEANPYVRSLLDAGHSLPFVYLHVGLTQAGYVMLFWLLWLSFLRHLPVLVETIVLAGARTWTGFLKAATGGGHLTVRQWLFPLRSSEVPHCYHGVWAVVVAVVFGVSLFRWYAALEWLELAPASPEARATVIASGLVGSLVVYFASLWRLCRRRGV